MQVLVSMQGDASGLGAIQEFASSANVLLTSTALFSQMPSRMIWR